MNAIALALALYTVTGMTAEPEVRVVRLGSDVAFAPSAEFLQRAIRLLSSCSVDSTSYAASPSAWDAALNARSLVHIKFATPHSLELVGEPVAIDEILIPLPEGKWPAHLFLRSGGVTRAFTKYRPGPLKGLVWAPPLALSAESPYSQLAEFADK